MQWYYAIDGQRHGPVSEQEFAQLIANGTITGETLVWRQGVDQWAPWSTLAASNPLPDVGGGGGAANPAGASPMPGAAGPEAASAAPKMGLEEFTEKLHVNGYHTSVGGILSRGWNTYKTAFGACFGVAVVGFLISFVSGMLPIIGLLSTFLVAPQITGGVMWYFLCRHRGEEPAFDVMFEGFSRAYVPLLLVGLLQFVIAFALVLPIGIGVGVLGAMAESSGGADNPAVAVGGGALLAVLGLIVALLMYRFTFAHVIVMDLGLGAVDSFKLSWRIFGYRFWTLVGLALMMMVLSLAGVIALLIGFLFVLPLLYSCLTQAYEDACQSAAGNPPQD